MSTILSEREARLRDAITEIGRAIVDAAYPGTPQGAAQRRDAAEEAVEKLQRIARAFDGAIHLLTDRLEAAIGSADFAERKEMTDAFSTTMDERIIPTFQRLAADFAEEVGHVDQYRGERITAEVAL